MSDIINEIARKLAAGETESQMTLPTPPANPASEVGNCRCYRCTKESGREVGAFPETMCRMILCETCGNKRCPHSTDHRNACTGSNEPDQPGSRYSTDYRPATEEDAPNG